MRPIHLHLVLPLFLLALSACPPKRIGKEVVWPDPPERPRIRFVTAFRSSADLDLSVSAELMRAALGGTRDDVLGRPTGIALSLDAQRLYIADPGLYRVMVADFAAKQLTEFAGPAKVGTPYGVAVDAAGQVYVVDQSGKRVVVFDPAGELKLVLGLKEMMIRPTGIAIDRQRGLVYVSDPAKVDSESHRIFVFDTSGKLLRTMGEGRGNGDGQFHFPVYLAVDGQGRLFVGDTMNFRVQVFEADGTYVMQYGSHGDGPGTFARIKGMAHDSFDNLYVADGESAVVQMFNSRFQQLMYFGGRQMALEYLDLPSGLAIDRKTNRIYVANELNARINVYELINTTAEETRTTP